MRPPFIILILLMLLFSASGIACTTIPQTHYYILGSGEHTGLSTKKDRQGLEIGVENFLVDPPYDQDRIVYRIGSQSPEVGFYAYHRWAVPLSQMLPKLVADSFVGISGIRSIEPVVQNQPYTAILNGRMMFLEEIDTAKGQQISIGIILTLRLRDGSLIWSDALFGEAMTEIKTVGAVVEQMRDTLVVVLAKGRESLSSTLIKTQ